jgi:hypothetical protein
MKAPRYTMVLIADGEEQKTDGNYLKKRMTQAAADKANDKLRAAADAAGIGPALAQRWERKGGPSILNKEEVAPVKKETPVLPPEYFKKPARKSLTAKSLSKGLTRFSKAGKDAFGGRIGTRMSKINLEVINAGKSGATVIAIAEKLGEPKGIVGAQLGWLFLHKKGLLTRTEEDDTFRYVATV